VTPEQALAFFLFAVAVAGTPGPRADARAPVGGRPVGFIGAAAFQWINPKSWLVCASATATFLEEGTRGAVGQSVAFGIVFVAASVPSCFPWLAFGAVLHRFLRAGPGRRIFNVAMGALLAASVILFVW
jgi:threonine/homoserine/homoserine lactone efflux protein